MANQLEARDAIYGRETPYSDLGLQGVNALSRFRETPTTAASVYNDPGYQFARDQGIQGIESTNAARGGLYSGNVLKELTNFNSGNANRFYNDAFSRNQAETTNRFNRFNALAGYGERSVGRQNAAGTHYADKTGEYLTGQGDASAAAELAGGRAEQNALAGAGGALYDAFRNPNASGRGSGGGNGAYVPTQAPKANYSPDATYSGGFYNEGGPVLVNDGGRMVPKVGTRGPRPGQGATGGGMSREAILQALDTPAAAAPTPPAAPRYRTMRDLQTEKALKDAGAYNRGGPVMGGRQDYGMGGDVHGPAGVDRVPAWLTDQEHVIPAPAVAALGNGSFPAGHNALLRMTKKLTRA